MEKSIKDGKLWNYGLLQYCVTPISSTIPSPLEALTGRKLRTSLPQIPSSIGKTVESSTIQKELIKRQLSTSTRSYSMELKSGQPVFYQGSTWRRLENRNNRSACQKTRFLLGKVSILRRTHRMIKPRSLPSHFELGDSEQWEQHAGIQDLQQSAELPLWQWGDQPVLQRVYCPGDSLCKAFSALTVWTFGTQWKEFSNIISSSVVISFQEINCVMIPGYSYSVMCCETI